MLLLLFYCQILFLLLFLLCVTVFIQNTKPKIDTAHVVEAVVEKPKKPKKGKRVPKKGAAPSAAPSEIDTSSTSSPQRITVAASSPAATPPAAVDALILSVQTTTEGNPRKRSIEMFASGSASGADTVLLKCAKMEAELKTEVKTEVKTEET